jgi:hypothetical protein
MYKEQTSDAFVDGGQPASGPSRDVDTARLAATPFQVITEEAIRMGRPTRYEIEKHATNEFAVAQERIAVKHAKKWRRALAQVAAKGNSGGYAAALRESKAKHVRKQIIALADAYVKTFDLFGVPSGAEAERSLEAEALRIAAGSSSAVMGELDLIQGRIRVSLPDTGSSVHREIHRSMQSAVNAGKLKLRRQRIKFEHSSSPSQRHLRP